ncbi:hypothetical protein Lgra_1540 [Legionella gratiana]|uniref:Uncharacterized protein n=1 Tax=Legionella gratiana TaxID=45066 RepID=A0A378JEI9_9GAMM|nr:hypothetical protein [Legionella gratiana]KTD12082.1 hypothetical protein Lgra_1540 [Legionella gratiana]STX46314.1 Uncharacterised protein [Legionella gratiana]
MSSKSCNWRAYLVYSIMMLILPSIADAGREHFERHRDGLVERPYEHHNYQNKVIKKHEHINVNNVNVNKTNVNVRVHGGVKPGHYYYKGKHYNYYNNGRYYNYYHNNNYYVYYNNGRYYNYFYNGMYYLYFINGIYYNYFYKGKYYKTCVPVPGNPREMVCH